MSQVAKGSSPIQHGNDRPEDGNKSQAEDQPTNSKPKPRRTKTDQPKAKSRPKRYSFVEDDAPEPVAPTRRPKSAMSSKFTPVHQAPQQRQYTASPDPRAYHQGFIPPRYSVPPSGYGFPPPQVAPQANQARPIAPPVRYLQPNAGLYGWSPPQQWNAYGQPIPPARPQMPPLPGFRPPLRRGPPTPLERGYHELKKELENIRLEQERSKKEKEKAERTKAKVARQATEREAIRKKAFEELRPVMDQYLRMMWREKNLTMQDTYIDPSRASRLLTGYDTRELQPMPRGSQRSLLSERDSSLSPTLEDFSQFLDQRRNQEGQWAYTPSMNSGSFNDPGSPRAELAACHTMYNPMIDPAFQRQIEVMMANMMPRILQQVQQGTTAPPLRDIAAEAADLRQQIIESWARGQTGWMESNPAFEDVPVAHPRKSRVDSGYVPVGDAANGEASNRGRARKKSKGRRRSYSRKKYHEQGFTAEDYPGGEVEFEMIPGRKPTPYGPGYSGIYAPEPP